MYRQMTIKMLTEWNVEGTPRRIGEIVTCGAAFAQAAVDHGKAEIHKEKHQKDKDASPES